MATLSDIGLAEPSTVTAKLRTITLDVNSTTVHSEVQVIGDPESTAFLARVSTGVPSTHAGLVTRSLIYQSSQADNRATIYQSTAGDLNVTVAGYSTTVNVSSLAGIVLVSPVSTASVRVHQSTAADLNVTVAGYVAPSTTVQVSSVAGIVLVSPVSTASVRVHQSTAGDLNVTVAGYVAPSTTVNVSSLAGRVSFAAQHATEGIINVADSTEAALRVNVVAGSAAGSTEATVRQSTYTDFNTLSRLADRDASTRVAAVLNASPVSTAYGLVTREAMRPATFWNSTSSTVTSTASTSLYAVISSAASTRACVFAFNLASTVGMVVEFLSSGGGAVWAVDLGAGAANGNLAVSPPARLFQTGVGEALNLRLASTGVQVRYSLSWFVE